MDKGGKSVEERCVRCVLEKNLGMVPPGAEEAKVREYERRVREIVRETDERPDGSAPEAASRVEALREEIFAWSPVDFGEVKRTYNALLLSVGEKLRGEIHGAPDPLRRAVQLAMAGNYIDFAALSEVSEEKLWELLGEAGSIPLPEEDYLALARKVREGRSLAYVTDNCGEVVLDRLLMEEMLRQNPELSITCIVRGAPVHNDATLEDASQVGMEAVARVIPNGTWMNGTVLRLLSREAREAICTADFVIAKGQANHETLLGCGLPVFYLFLCKCELFVEKYGSPLLTGVLIREGKAVQGDR